MNRRRKWILLSVILSLTVGSVIYTWLTSGPRNSVELYNTIAFETNYGKAQKVMLDGYETHLKKEDLDYIASASNVPDSISQMTLFVYDEKTYMLLTTPGTEKLKVLAVEELPEEVRQYFKEVTPE